MLCWFAPFASAMTFGPTLILQCPESGKLVQQVTLNSGNTMDGQLWSDGYAEYPSLPDSPKITRCEDQGKLFWVAEAKVVAKLDMFGNSLQDWPGVSEVRFLSEQEYLEAIAQGMGETREKELYLRVHAWWAANWHYEEGHTTPFLQGSQARDNLEHLVKLLNADTPDARLQKAEALRELGRFKEAQQTLQTTFPKQMKGVVGWFRKLIEKRDVMVKRIPFGGQESERRH